jgi:hypothetical protein
MTREAYLAAANDLGLANDPTVRAVMDLLYASHAAEMRKTEDQIALCQRVGAQLDSVQMRVPMVEG